ncbi:hypothetical protein ACQ4PT_011943 [Festuca glaucescens]
MAEKVKEAEMKKASKARNREGEKGQWWPGNVTDFKLKALQEEGFIAPGSCRFNKDSLTPTPEVNERVLTKAWVERGLSLPPSDFFLEVLNTYGLQPHNICPNAYLLLSNFVTLCEGHLGVRPDIRLLQFFYRVKKETKEKNMVNCGSMTFVLSTKRPLWFNRRLIYAYTGVDDPLRVTKDNLPADSLNKRIRTLVKVTRGQVVPEISKDIHVNGDCPLLNTLAEEDFGDIFRIAVADSGKAEETPEEEEEEEEEQTEKYAPRPSKRPRGGSSGPDVDPSAEGSAKKAKTTPAGGPRRLDSKHAERERLKMLATSGKGARRSFLLGPSADPAAGKQASKEVIPVSRGRKDESCSGNFRAAAEKAKDKEEAEVTSADKAEAPADDAIVFAPETGDPSDCHATPKAYATKFFHKLTETEKWELEQDLLNSFLSNAWSKADAQSYEIEQHKKKTCELLDNLLVKRKEQQALHYELHKNIALQRRVSLRQAELLEDEKEKVAKLEKKLEESQGANLKNSLATASSELESLRSAHKYLESKLKGAEEKQKLAEDQLAQKNSEFIRVKADLQEKRKKDSDMIQKLQSEVQMLRTYMRQAEAGWDLLDSEVFEPLGYNKERREQFLRDDLIKLAGYDCKDLISTSRKICYNLAMKDSRSCDVRELIGKMAVLPELVVDLQASSNCGAAQMALAMCLARAPTLNLEEATASIPEDSNMDELLDACSGYDTRIARRVRHDELYDKVILPADEAIEEKLLKKAEAEKKPAGSGDSSQFTWTSSKEADKDKTKSGDDASSSPAHDAEK